jgi:hypothetical protein
VTAAATLLSSMIFRGRTVGSRRGYAADGLCSIPGPAGRGRPCRADLTTQPGDPLMKLPMRRFCRAAVAGPLHAQSTFPDRRCTSSFPRLRKLRQHARTGRARVRRS